MSQMYDAIVIGGGIIGASTLFHLSELGCPNTLLLERNAIASGGTGKSCAILRTHYSVLSNTELAVGSLAMFRDLKASLDDPEAESGFVNSGYLILAKEGIEATRLLDNLALQRDHGASTEQVSARQARGLHPLLNVSDVAAIGYEPESGYADPHLTTASFARAATSRGGKIRTNTPVTEILVENESVRGVRTPDGDLYSDVVISVIGPWTEGLTLSLGIKLPLETYRHTVLTLKAAEYGPNLPIVKDLTVENKMYFRSESGMILVGTGDYGELVDDPDVMDVQPELDLVALQTTQIAHRVPSFADARIAGSWFGPYDITPDWNPVIDAAPGISGLYLAFGFSGHGFKLGPMVGRVLAQKVLGQRCDVDISPYRLSRFIEGEQLAGIYGAGSIS